MCRPLRIAFCICAFASLRDVRAESWTLMANVTQHADYNRWACVVGDALGWHYTYMQGDPSNNSTWRLYCREQLPNHTWSSATKISNVLSEESRIGKYSDGTRFVVFQGQPGSTDEWMITENSGVSWSAATYLTPNDGASDLCTDVNRVVDIDSADTIHLLSQHNTGGSGDYAMRYYCKPRAGAVQDMGDVVPYASMSPTGNYQINGAIRVTGSGATQAVHFLVAGGPNVGGWRCYYRRYQNNAFGPIINLSNIVAASPNGAHAGNIAALPSGQLIACLATNDAATSGNWEVFLLKSDDNGTSWHTPINVSQTGNVSRNPDCVVDSQGEVVVAWEETTSPVSIKARRWRPGTGLGQPHTLGPGFTVCVASHGTKTRAAWHNSSLTGDWEIVTSETDAIDTQPPSPVSQFVATAGNTQNGLSWRLPAEVDTAGAQLRYRTDHFPANHFDGTLLADIHDAPLSIQFFTHAGLTNGTTYYYAVFAYDDALNFATGVTAVATPAMRMDFDRDGDIDLTDFAHLQTCLTGPSQPTLPGCLNADIEGDLDVDTADVTAFLTCFSGPQIYANPACGN